MPAFTVGDTRGHHVEEWQGPFASPEELFAGFDPAVFDTFAARLPPGTYLRDENAVYAFVQSWVLERAAETGARVVPAHFGGCHYAWIDRTESGFCPRYEP